VITLANMGLPMIGVVWSAGWLLLIPIILIEWKLACGLLRIPARAGLEVAGIANLASTILAIPVAWGFMFILALLTPSSGNDSFLGVVNNVVVHSAWLAPWKGAGNWVVTAAAATLCVPCFFASVLCEGLIAKSILLSKFPQAPWWRWAWMANTATYGGIVMCLLGLLLFQLNR